MKSGIVQPKIIFNLFLTLLIIFAIQPTIAMKIVIQRVKSASVTINMHSQPTTISSIGPGMLALVGLHTEDTLSDLEWCTKKLLAIKLWENENGGMWRQHVKQKEYEILCVSQFTLYGTLSKKNQPDYKLAMKSVQAEEMYNTFLDMLRKGYVEDRIKDGMFGEMMDVELVNDGPVTLVIDSREELMEGRMEGRMESGELFSES
jgi:D-tyrosyl-tRNA(Tyr) deacylase